MHTLLSTKRRRSINVNDIHEKSPCLRRRRLLWQDDDVLSGLVRPHLSRDRPRPRRGDWHLGQDLLPSRVGPLCQDERDVGPGLLLPSSSTWLNWPGGLAGVSMTGHNMVWSLFCGNLCRNFSLNLLDISKKASCRIGKILAIFSTNRWQTQEFAKLIFS